MNRDDYWLYPGLRQTATQMQSVNTSSLRLSAATWMSCGVSQPAVTRMPPTC